MKIRSGDKVKVISGKDKGKISTVLMVLKSKNLVVVEGVNKVKKHVKPGKGLEKGGIVEVEKPVDASNVMFYSEALGKASRVGFSREEKKRSNVVEKNKEVLEPKKKGKK